MNYNNSATNKQYRNYRIYERYDPEAEKEEEKYDDDAADNEHNYSESNPIEIPQSDIDRDPRFRYGFRAIPENYEQSTAEFYLPINRDHRFWMLRYGTNTYNNCWRHLADVTPAPCKTSDDCVAQLKQFCSDGAIKHIPHRCVFNSSSSRSINNERTITNHLGPRGSSLYNNRFGSITNQPQQQNNSLETRSSGSILFNPNVYGNISSNGLWNEQQSEGVLSEMEYGTCEYKLF